MTSIKKKKVRTSKIIVYMIGLFIALTGFSCDTKLTVVKREEKKVESKLYVDRVFVSKQPNYNDTKEYNAIDFIIYSYDTTYNLGLSDSVFFINDAKVFLNKNTVITLSDSAYTRVRLLSFYVDFYNEPLIAIDSLVNKYNELIKLDNLYLKYGNRSIKIHCNDESLAVYYPGYR